MVRGKRLPQFENHEDCSILSATLNAQMAEHPEWGRRRSYPARSVLWHADETRHRVFLLEVGRVRICESSPNGSEPLVETVREGQLFGELCFCRYQDFPLGTSAQTVTAARVVEAAAIDFDDLLRQKPAFTAKLVETFCRKLRYAEQRARILSIRDGQRRLERMLLHLVMERGRGREAEPGRMTVTVSHAELASMTAMTRPHTTVIMTRLRAEGMVGYGRGSALSVDVARLTARCE